MLIWDFDGVIVDTVRECYILTLRTIEREKDYLAREAGIAKFAPIPFSDFEVYRSKSVNAADFFANYILHHTGLEMNEENLEKVTKKHQPFLKKMDIVFYEERDRLMNENKAEYFGTLKVYAGIPKTLESLSNLGIKHAIMSARDSHSIKQILTHFKLLRHFEYIIGHEVNKGDRHVKGMQISMLKGHFEEKYGDVNGKKTDLLGKTASAQTGTSHASKSPGKIEYSFIDDIPFNLKKVEGQANLLFAKWGYGKLPRGYVDCTVAKMPSNLPSLLAPKHS